MLSSVIIGIVWSAAWIWFLTWLIGNERFIAWLWRIQNRAAAVFGRRK